MSIAAERRRTHRELVAATARSPDTAPKVLEGGAPFHPPDEESGEQAQVEQL